MTRSILVCLAVAAMALALPGAAAAQGPALRPDRDALEAALRCPDAFEDTEREPLLLVHGTFGTPEENWGWNYAAALPDKGWDVCTVTLPDRSTGDIQASSEYVVFAIREIAARSGSKVDVMGHSQGGLQPRWAIRWWPDVEQAVDDLVMLAVPNHGSVVVDPAYETGCFPACYQMSTRSDFIAALNAGDETPGAISYTSIYSLDDEVVQPAAPEPTAALDGASNILVQDLCPGRRVGHLGLAYDAAVYEMVIDALTHPGPADPSRFEPLTCASIWFDGVDPSVFPELAGDNAIIDFFGRPEFGGPREEPPLAPYANGPGTAGSGDHLPRADGGGGPSRTSSAVVRGEVLPATGGAPALALGLVALSPATLLRLRRRRRGSG